MNEIPNQNVKGICARSDFGAAIAVSNTAF